MAFLNGIFMLAPQQLGELPYWGWLGAILDFLNSGIGNAAWTMIVFTVILKLVTFPLDFLSRYMMKKNAVIMEDMKPQLEKLEKQCKGDKQLYNQRMLPLLKKEGYSVGGACLPTLLTLVLFILVFRGLNTYSTYRNAHTYDRLVMEYNVMTAAQDDEEFDENDEEYKQIYQNIINRLGLNSQDYEANGGGLGLDEETDKALIEQNLIQRYDELNPPWLWIKNPWRPDMPYAEGFINIIAKANPIPTFEEFTHIEGKSNFGVGAIDIDSNEATDGARKDYNTIMDSIARAKGTGNGYYILIVLAVGISFLSQYIMQKTQKTSQQAAGSMGAGTMKFMMILFPIMLGFFALNYSSVFTLYIVTNSTFSLLSTLFINYVVGIKMKKLKANKLAQTKYRR